MPLNWEPTASISNLRARADFLQQIRLFFAQKNVMEVDAPLLCRTTTTAVHLDSFAVVCSHKGEGLIRYLQTSPEYAMKRLIAAGSGPIYYLGKAFRKEEIGGRHNPEFTMLEWYRPQWSHFELIQEVDALFKEILGCQSAQTITYQNLFESYFNIQPHIAALDALQNIAIESNLIPAKNLPELDKDGWLDLLFSFGIEPHLGKDAPIAVIDFPASQASLAKIRQVEDVHSYAVAERFEFYYRGMELANGFHELTCAKEQGERFEADLKRRNELNLCELPVDHDLLAALASGFPACSGVAIGVDRLLMLKLNEPNIAHVLPFAWERA